MITSAREAMVDEKEFEKTLENFKKIEDSRDQLWDRAKKLILSGFEVEAYVLILSTWNFANFRYIMKTFNIAEFHKTITTVNPIFKELEVIEFRDIDFNDKRVIEKIKSVYGDLKKIAKQTGATKIMALKNSNLFIMWDTEIRRMYKISNKCRPEDYIEFLYKMNLSFNHIKWPDKKTPFAKAIDEYNYVLADKARGKRKVKIIDNERP